MRIAPTRCLVTFALSSLSVVGCGGNDSTPDPFRPFGDSAVVTILNPVVNTAHNLEVPASYGDARSGIVVDANPGGAATTDVTGLARVTPLVIGTERARHRDGHALAVHRSRRG